ncbi:MAG: methionine--tRNA ligase [Candidatus Omnitrophica bacterium CG11_big_fil_rev_8_21_14_0_20_45_26]|uniref:Methionine--tRNA ligase n=1 Tax=Candidatus Abzuiibacterium crystallinum TaxID=1974748 RepID=A0A2H0LSA8_9BACT|nr:MAG: methionine--tRNA ligase [Candidatus Omnitrophica bacterium CG11_big_fil_rev_8_21_14_0_20_45_26]PIW65779.1 MAG: methionine--tRNA ligase [Candidatus Omnitrophica bacterium CG12_big_fil_rev_8_21_14_0_65_45_16]
MATKYYITTPLYYVNAKPHIGHAYTNILCDTFARFHRLKDEDVFFMTGTDEHGTKIAKAAKDQGMEPKAYADQMIPHFESLWKLLGIQYDFFFRTTSQMHRGAVQQILKDLEAKGDIYKSKYVGWYSVKSETFYSESELVDGKCPDTGGEVQRIEEENYFFKMSKYRDWLIDYIQKTPGFIQPDMRRNEILGFLKQPLEDLCITRPRERLSWGIPYPGSDEYVIYVWFDALVNYVSGVGYARDAEQFKKWWPADVHVIGKDILRHHAVYWPIMLKACGIEMPKKILAHGWWTLSGAKVSKSSGNVVDPVGLSEKYGVDAFRYFLLNEVTLGLDGAYSEDLIRERYRTDLANDLGNLWFRTASMIDRYFGGKIPKPGPDTGSDALLSDAKALFSPVREAMETYNPRDALGLIWKVVKRANQYVEENKPWQLAKQESGKQKLADVLFVLADTLAHMACLLQPFLPGTAQKILTRLQLKSPLAAKSKSDFEQMFVKNDVSIERGDALFPKLEDEAA